MPLSGTGQPKLVNTVPTLLKTSSDVPVARLETPFKIPGEGAVKSWKMKQRTVGRIDIADPVSK